MRTDSAPADGVTPVSALLIFQGSAGDPATNGHQKILDLAPHGLGVQRNPAPQSGHILKDGREYLDVDECSSGSTESVE